MAKEKKRFSMLTEVDGKRSSTRWLAVFSAVLGALMSAALFVAMFMQIENWSSMIPIVMTMLGAGVAPLVAGKVRGGSRGKL